MKNLFEYISNNHVGLVAVGDILAHEEINTVANDSVKGYRDMFSGIESILRKYDLRFCNQETLIGGSELGVHGGELVAGVCTRFNAPESLGRAVVGVGFNLISLANNHVCDMKGDGISNSVAFWKKQNCIVSGQDGIEFQLFEKNGIKFAFAAYTSRINGTRKLDDDIIKRVNVFDENKFRSSIVVIRSKVDVVIVSMHWGTEYRLGIPDYEQKHISQILSDCGVDIVLGHHPHVVEPIEKVGNTLVVYSLGNCLACQNGDVVMKRIGGMIGIDIDKFGNKISIKTSFIEPTYICYDNKYSYFRVKLLKDVSDKDLLNHRIIYKEYKNNYFIEHETVK